MSTPPRRRRTAGASQSTAANRAVLREYTGIAAKLGISARDLNRLDKLTSLIQTLPELVIERVGERHLRLGVRKKTFAYYLNDHHGDGIVCVCCKSTQPRQAELLRDTDNFAFPAYLGVSGWISLRLDRGAVKWDEALNLLIDAYRMQAPRRLVEEM